MNTPLPAGYSRKDYQIHAADTAIRDLLLQAAQTMSDGDYIDLLLYVRESLNAQLRWYDIDEAPIWGPESVGLESCEDSTIYGTFGLTARNPIYKRAFDGITYEVGSLKPSGPVVEISGPEHSLLKGGK